MTSIMPYKAYRLTRDFDLTVSIVPWLLARMCLRSAVCAGGFSEGRQTRAEQAKCMSRGILYTVSGLWVVVQEQASD